MISVYVDCHLLYLLKTVSSNNKSTEDFRNAIKKFKNYPEKTS